MKNNLYISSKIKGIENYQFHFYRLAEKYKPSYSVINPITLSKWGKVKAFLTSKSVLFNNNWKFSVRCKFEYLLAKILFKNIIFETKRIYKDFLISYEAGKNNHNDKPLFIVRNSRLISARSKNEAVSLAKIIKKDNQYIPFIIQIDNQNPDFQYVTNIKEII